MLQKVCNYSFNCQHKKYGREKNSPSAGWWRIVPETHGYSLVGKYIKTIIWSKVTWYIHGINFTTKKKVEVTNLKLT